MPGEHREDRMDVENGAGGACSGTGRTGEGVEIGHAEHTGQNCVPS